MNALDRTHSPLRSLKVLAALACAVGAPSAIAASAPEEPASLAVRYADLDLSKEEGAATLYQRIRSAARSVCDVHGSKELAQVRLARDCYTTAVADAVASIDEPLVTAMHRSRVEGSGTG